MKPATKAAIALCAAITTFFAIMDYRATQEVNKKIQHTKQREK